MTLIEILESRKEALNVEEVAGLLGVSEKKVYRLAAAGVLPAFRVGKSVRFDPEDVADWLRKKKSANQQCSAKKAQSNVTLNSGREGQERPLPDDIWRDRVKSLESVLAMGTSSDSNS